MDQRTRHLNQKFAATTLKVVQWSLFVAAAIAAGFVFVAAFEPKLFAGVEWFALVPFLLPFWSSSWSPRRFFAWGWLAGTAAFVVYLWWFFDILPLDWLELATTPTIVGIVALTVFLAAGYFGLSFGLLCALARKLGGKSLYRTVCLLVALWPLFEYVRTFGYSFHPYVWGASSIVGDHAGFMLLSYAGASHAFVRAVAPVLGEYGTGLMLLVPNLLFLVVLAVVYPAWSVRLAANLTGHMHFADVRNAFLFLVSSAATLLLLGVFAQGADEQSSQGSISIGVIQTNIATADFSIRNIEERKEYDRRRARIVSLVGRVLTENPDVIVMPEGAPSVFEASSGSPYPTLENIISVIGTTSRRVVLDAAFPPKSWDAHINPVTVLDNVSGPLGTYEKRFLMPWGEYTPTLTTWASGLVGFDWRNYRFEFHPGTGAGAFETVHGHIGILTCSELLSPQLAREIVRAGAEIIIFSSSDAILRGSARLQGQNLAMARIRAAALRKSMVYVSNGGRSFALDARGEILWQSSGIGEEVAVVEVTLNRKKTLAAYLLP